MTMYMYVLYYYTTDEDGCIAIETFGISNKLLIGEIRITQNIKDIHVISDYIHVHVH